MKNFKLYLLLPILFSLSCSNEELEPTILTLLTDNGSKSWRTVEIDVNGEVDNTDCTRDDILTFVLFDETTEAPYFQLEDNVLACEGGDYINFRGTWRINNKGNRITLVTRDDFLDIDDEQVTDFENISYDIVEISDSKLVLREYAEWDEFAPQVYTITFNEF